MADRGAVPEKQKFERWQRAVEDRLGQLERRKVQGDLAFDTIHSNGDASIAGNLTVAGSLAVTGDAHWRDALSGIIDIQTGFANTGAGIAALTTAFQDLPGTARTFTPQGRNATIQLVAMFDMNIATTGVGQIFGCMNVNGVDNGIVAIQQDTGLANNRNTHAMTHNFNVPLSGLTLTMRARKTINAGTASIPGTISIWTWVFIDRE